MTTGTTTAQGTADEKAEGAAQAAADTESTQATDSTETAAKAEAEAAADTQSGEAEAPEDWKAHARQWERRAKADRKQVESLMAAISDKDATIEGLRTEVAERQRAAERTEKIAAAASEYGVPADLIRGDTDEEIAEYAKRLADWRGESAAPVVPKLSDSGAGAFPARPAILSIDDQILAAQQSGDFKLSSRLKAIKLTQLARG
nr:MAG TPA: hypothetical protein [Caudoviricetes sp.]DAS53067.1 MAG TPA: hypothetical protein [Caudoviricetes sp.]